MPDFLVDQQPLSDLLLDQERAVIEAVPQAVDNAADGALSHIVRRTGRGVSTSGRRFVDYSEAYARRENGGRRQPVTLVRRGDMLRDLYVAKTGRGRRSVKFRSRRQERKGRAHQFGRRVPQRRWFGVTVAFQRRLFQRFQSDVQTKLPRDRRRRFQIVITL